jgi:hypothetical protein
MKFQTERPEVTEEEKQIDAQERAHRARKTTVVTDRRSAAKALEEPVPPAKLPSHELAQRQGFKTGDPVAEIRIPHRVPSVFGSTGLTAQEPDLDDLGIFKLTPDEAQALLDLEKEIWAMYEEKGEYSERAVKERHKAAIAKLKEPEADLSGLGAMNLDLDSWIRDAEQKGEALDTRIQYKNKKAKELCLPILKRFEPQLAALARDIEEAEIRAAAPYGIKPRYPSDLLLSIQTKLSRLRSKIELGFSNINDLTLSPPSNLIGDLVKEL